MGENERKCIVFDGIIPKFSHSMDKSGALSLLNPPTWSFFRGVIDMKSSGSAVAPSPGGAPFLGGGGAAPPPPATPEPHVTLSRYAALQNTGHCYFDKLSAGIGTVYRGRHRGSGRAVRLDSRGGYCCDCRRGDALLAHPLP